jgi:mannose/fructose/N-acetylgalactosamine-specific phosphotransferase system component IIC
VIVPFTFEDILILTGIAGLLAVDERAGWHSLVAQPVFAAALVGLVFDTFAVALSVGLILELVWLSILPMRGMRRPDAVAGAVAGAGAACLLIRHTGDPRTMLVVSWCAVTGLICGEVAGTLGRRFHILRERILGGFVQSVGDQSTVAPSLTMYMLGSICFVFLAEAILVGIMLPATIFATEWITATAGGTFTSGARVWADLVPALGAGAVIQMYWHKQQNRYLVLCAGIFLLLLWIR